MRESTYNQGVNKLIPKPFIHWKVSDRVRRGLPDNAYLGASGRVLWVEYKFDRTPPPVLELTNTRRYLSALQQDFLLQLSELGHQIAVIYGTDLGGIYLPGLEWQKPWKREEVVASFCDKRTLAEHIGTILDGNTNTRPNKRAGHH